LAEAVADGPPESAASIRSSHEQLTAALGLDAAAAAPVTALLEELDRVLRGIALTREASPRLQARVMATGELASTRLGEAWLRAGAFRCAGWTPAR